MSTLQRTLWHGWPAQSLLMIASVAVCANLAHAENLYPDPGFEATGVTGEAHSGGRAGHLQVAARNRWGELGATLTVEPFARYRVTEWVKGTITAGTFFAPHCYDWNSYEWAFASSHVMQTTGEWTKMETTFVAPDGTMRVNALAYANAGNSEAWVDDVVVEKIAEPAEVMAEVEAKTARTDDETQMLARWYLKQGQVDKAAGLMRAAAGITRTDIANQIARQIEDPAARRPYVVEMLAYGGPTWHAGMDRFAQITRDFSDEEKVLVAAEALAANAGDERAVRTFRMIVERSAAAGAPLGTVAESAARVTRTREALQRAAAQIPAGTPAAGELAKVVTAMDETAKEVDARRRRLGACSVRIGGQESAAKSSPRRPTRLSFPTGRPLRRSTPPASCVTTWSSSPARSSRFCERAQPMTSRQSSWASADRRDAWRARSGSGIWGRKASTSRRQVRR